MMYLPSAAFRCVAYDSLVSLGAKGGIVLHLENSPTFTLQSDELIPREYKSAGEKFKWLECEYTEYRTYLQDIAALGGCSALEFWYNPERYRNAPFFRQVHFSYAQPSGFFGPRTCEVLHREYEAYEKDAQKLLNEKQYKKYQTWKRGLVLAANSGVITIE